METGLGCSWTTGLGAASAGWAGVVADDGGGCCASFFCFSRSLMRSKKANA